MQPLKDDGKVKNKFPVTFYSELMAIEFWIKLPFNLVLFNLKP